MSATLRKRPPPTQMLMLPRTSKPRVQDKSKKPKRMVVSLSKPLNEVDSIDKMKVIVENNADNTDIEEKSVRDLIDKLQTELDDEEEKEITTESTVMDNTSVLSALEIGLSPCQRRMSSGSTTPPTPKTTNSVVVATVTPPPIELPAAAVIVDKPLLLKHIPKKKVLQVVKASSLKQTPKEDEPSQEDATPIIPKLQEEIPKTVQRNVETTKKTSLIHKEHNEALNSESDNESSSSSSSSSSSDSDRSSRSKSRQPSRSHKRQTRRKSHRRSHSRSRSPDEHRSRSRSRRSRSRSRKRTRSVSPKHEQLRHLSRVHEDEGPKKKMNPHEMLGISPNATFSEAFTAFLTSQNNSVMSSQTGANMPPPSPPPQQTVDNTTSQLQPLRRFDTNRVQLRKQLNHNSNYHPTSHRYGPTTQSTHRNSNVHFSKIEKPYQQQCVVIIGAGLEKVAHSVFHKEGFIFFHYRAQFENAAAQITPSYSEEFATKLERMLPREALYIKFYHWARTQSPNAKLAISGITPFTKKSVEKLQGLGAVYVTKWPQSATSIPTSFLWLQAPIQILWRVPQQNSTLIRTPQNQLMPRVGWSRTGPNMVVILLGLNASVAPLLSCGCFVYNEMWQYENIALAIFQYGNAEEFAFREFAKKLRIEAQDCMNSGLVVRRFIEWWKSTCCPSAAKPVPKAQAVLCGLDAVADVAEIKRLQKMGAIVCCKEESLTACEVEDIDIMYTSDEDLMERFKKMYHSGRNVFIPSND